MTIGVEHFSMFSDVSGMDFESLSWFLVLRNCYRSCFGHPCIEKVNALVNRRKEDWKRYGLHLQCITLLVRVYGLQQRSSTQFYQGQLRRDTPEAHLWRPFIDKEGYQFPT
jgi:hypothetical protein